MLFDHCQQTLSLVPWKGSSISCTSILTSPWWWLTLYIAGRNIKTHPNEMVHACITCVYHLLFLQYKQKKYLNDRNCVCIELLFVSNKQKYTSIQIKQTRWWTRSSLSLLHHRSRSRSPPNRQKLQKSIKKDMRVHTNLLQSPPQRIQEQNLPPWKMMFSD
jgi:hypothetical protein